MAIPEDEKEPLNAWIAAVRKRLFGNNLAAFAKELGVSTETIKGWESRGHPNPDNLGKIERLAGEPAPKPRSQPTMADMIRALDAQTKAVNSLVLELRGLALGAVRLGEQQSNGGPG
jgi:hypothetical protein